LVSLQLHHCARATFAEFGTHKSDATNLIVTYLDPFQISTATTSQTIGAVNADQKINIFATDNTRILSIALDFGTSGIIDDNTKGIQAFKQLKLGGVNGVPEASTWAMMLIGFGGMGAAIRARRRSEKLAAT